MGKYSLKKRKGIRKQQSFKKRKGGGWGESFFVKKTDEQKEQEKKKNEQAKEQEKKKKEQAKMDKLLKDMGPNFQLSGRTDDYINKRKGNEALINLFKNEGTDFGSIYDSNEPANIGAKNLISKFSSDEGKKQLFLKAKSVVVPDKKIQELTFDDLRKILKEIDNQTPQGTGIFKGIIEKTKTPQKLTKKGAVIKKYQESRVDEADIKYKERIREDHKYWSDWGRKFEELCSTTTPTNMQVTGYIFNDFKKYYIYKIEAIGSIGFAQVNPRVVVGNKTKINENGQTVKEIYEIEFGPHLSKSLENEKKDMKDIVDSSKANDWTTFSNALENLLYEKLLKNKISKPDLLKLSDTKEAAEVKDQQKLKEQTKQKVELEKKQKENEEIFYYKVFHLPELVGRPGFYFNLSVGQKKSYKLFTNMDGISNDVGDRELIDILFKKNDNKESLYDQWLRKINSTSQQLFTLFKVMLMKKILFKDKENGENWSDSLISKYFQFHQIDLEIGMSNREMKNFNIVNWKYASDDEYVKDLVGKNLFYLLVLVRIYPQEVENIFSHIYNKNFFTDEQLSSVSNGTESQQQRTNEEKAVDNFFDISSQTNKNNLKLNEFLKAKKSSWFGSKKNEIFLGELAKEFDDFTEDTIKKAGEIKKKIKEIAESQQQQPPPPSGFLWGGFSGGGDEDDDVDITRISTVSTNSSQSEQLQQQKAKQEKQANELKAFDEADRTIKRVIDNFDSLKRYVEHKAEYHIKKYELLVKYYQVVWEKVVGAEITEGKYFAKKFEIWAGDERIMETVTPQNEKNMKIHIANFEKNITLLKVIVYHLTKNILLYAINSFILDCYISKENFKDADDGIYRKVRQKQEQKNEKFQELYELELTDEPKDNWQWKVFKKQAKLTITEADVGEESDKNYKLAIENRMNQNVKKGGNKQKDENLVVLSKGRKRGEGGTATEEEVDRTSIFDKYDATILYRNPNMYEPVLNKEGIVVPKLRKEYEGNDDYSQNGRRFYLQEFIYWLNIDFIEHVMREKKTVMTGGGEEDDDVQLDKVPSSVNTDTPTSVVDTPTTTTTVVAPAVAAPTTTVVAPTTTTTDAVSATDAAVDANAADDDDDGDAPTTAHTTTNTDVDANAATTTDGDAVVDANAADAAVVVDAPAVVSGTDVSGTDVSGTAPVTAPAVVVENADASDDAPDVVTGTAVVLNSIDYDPCKNIISDLSKYEDNKWMEIFLGVNINEEEQKIKNIYATDEAAEKIKNKKAADEADRAKNVMSALDEQFDSIDDDDDDGEILQALDVGEEDEVLPDTNEGKFYIGGGNKKMNPDKAGHEKAKQYINDKVVCIEGPKGLITINNFLLFTFASGGDEIRQKDTKINGWLLLDLRNLIKKLGSKDTELVSRNSISGLLKKAILEPLPQTYQEKIEKLKFEINEENIKLKIYQKNYSENVKEYNQAVKKDRLEDKEESFQNMKDLQPQVEKAKQSIQKKRLEIKKLNENENKQKGGVGPEYSNDTAGPAHLSPPSSIDYYKKRQGDSKQQSQTLFVPSYVKTLYISNNVDTFLMEKDNSDDSQTPDNYVKIIH